MQQPYTGEVAKTTLVLVKNREMRDLSHNIYINGRVMEFAYEEDNDEISEIVIKTHQLRAEKVRLNERLRALKAIAEQEIGDARAKVSSLRIELSDLDMQMLGSSHHTAESTVSCNERFRPPIDASNWEWEIGMASDRLRRMKSQLEKQKANQAEEIEKLKKTATKNERMLSTLLAENDSIESDNRRKALEIKRLKEQLAVAETDEHNVQTKLAAREHEIGHMAVHAGDLISRIYRPRSDHC